MGGVEAIEALTGALESVEGRREVRAALCRLLAPIREYDERTQSDLAATLRTFIALGGNLQATAEALFLHRNSVGYRLQRIEALTGVDPRDRQARLTLTAAFAIADPEIMQPRPEEEVQR